MKITESRKCRARARKISVNIIAGLACLLLPFGQIGSIRSERAVWLGFISYLAYYLLFCSLPDKRCLSPGMCLYRYHVMMTLHFLNDVANDAESTKKSKITSLSLVWRVKQWVNWYIEYQVRVFWYQVYQARLWERMLNRSASLAMSTSIPKALPCKFDIKRHSPSILYVLGLKLWHHLLHTPSCCRMD